MITQMVVATGVRVKGINHDFLMKTCLKVKVNLNKVANKAAITTETKKRVNLISSFFVEIFSLYMSCYPQNLRRNCLTSEAYLCLTSCTRAPEMMMASAKREHNDFPPQWMQIIKNGLVFELN